MSCSWTQTLFRGLILSFSGLRKQSSGIWETQTLIKCFTIFICSAQFVFRSFCKAVGVSRLVCGPQFRMLAHWVTRMLSQVMLHRWRVNDICLRILMLSGKTFMPSKNANLHTDRFFSFVSVNGQSCIAQIAWKGTYACKRLKGNKTVAPGSKTLKILKFIWGKTFLSIRKRSNSIAIAAEAGKEILCNWEGNLLCIWIFFRSQTMRRMKTIFFAEFRSTYYKMQGHSTTFCNFCWKLPAEKMKRCGQIQAWEAEVALNCATG